MGAHFVKQSLGTFVHTMSSIKEHYNKRYRGIDESSLPPADQDTFGRRFQFALAQLPAILTTVIYASLP